MVDRLAGGARASQHLDNVVVMTPARAFQWPPNIVVQVGTSVDQQSHDLIVTFLASDRQRRVITFVPFVYVGTRVDQQPHDLEVTCLASDIQRRIFGLEGPPDARGKKTTRRNPFNPIVPLSPPLIRRARLLPVAKYGR